MSRSFYFLSSFSQHLVDGAPTTTSLSPRQMMSNAISVYQPIIDKQLVLPDASRCIAVKAFLRLVGIPFIVAETINSHEASPAGTVPFLVVDKGSLCVAEWKPIVSWARMNGKTLTAASSNEQRQSTDIAIWSEAIERPLRLAELHVTYEWNENFDKYATPRIGSVHTWPLSWAIPKRRRNEALAELKSSIELFSTPSSTMGTSFSPLEDADRLLTAVSLRLGSLKEKDGWLTSSADDGPTEADCLLFGHLRAILDNPLPRDDLRELVLSKQLLVKFCHRFHSYLSTVEKVAGTTERPPSDVIIIPNERVRTISVETDKREPEN